VNRDLKDQPAGAGSVRKADQTGSNPNGTWISGIIKTNKVVVSPAQAGIHAYRHGRCVPRYRPAPGWCCLVL